MSPHNLDYDSSSSDSGKQCKGCARMLPLTAYSVDAYRTDRLRGKCKECCSQNTQLWRASKTRATDEEPAAKRPKLVPTIPGEHLYVMAFSTDPDGLLSGLKVGRSGNIDRRAHELGNSMPFHVIVLATFPGQGHLEDVVHAMLAAYRNGSGRGREWFHAPLTEILQSVVYAMQARANVNGGAPGAREPQPSSGSSWCCAPLVGSEEEGPCRYSEAGGDICEEEGGEAGVPSGSACEGEDCF